MTFKQVKTAIVWSSVFAAALATHGVARASDAAIPDGSNPPTASVSDQGSTTTDSSSVSDTTTQSDNSSVEINSQSSQSVEVSIDGASENPVDASKDSNLSNAPSDKASADGTVAPGSDPTTPSAPPASTLTIPTQARAIFMTKLHTANPIITSDSGGISPASSEPSRPDRPSPLPASNGGLERLTGVLGSIVLPTLVLSGLGQPTGGFIPFVVLLASLIVVGVARSIGSLFINILRRSGFSHAARSDVPFSSQFATLELSGFLARGIALRELAFLRVVS